MPNPLFSCSIKYASAISSSEALGSSTARYWVERLAAAPAAAFAADTREAKSPFLNHVVEAVFLLLTKGSAPLRVNARSISSSLASASPSSGFPAASRRTVARSGEQPHVAAQIRRIKLPDADVISNTCPCWAIRIPASICSSVVYPRRCAREWRFSLRPEC